MPKDHHTLLERIGKVIRQTGEAWGEHKVSRISWRDQAAARMRDSMKEWGIDPYDRGVALGVVIGTWWTSREVQRLVDEGARLGSIRRTHLYRHMADLTQVALDLHEEAERRCACIDDAASAPDEAEADGA